MLQHVSPPLASAYLKLMRAQEHLDPLVAKIRHFENSRPYRLVRETDEDAGEHVVYALLNEPPGAEWYGPFGDVINNLHGVLDHAVFGLSQFFEGRPLTDGEARSVEFPIFTVPLKWERFVASKMPALRFLPDPHKSVVEREQPCRGSNEYFRNVHPMHVLHTLWNLDKHRQISSFAGFGKVLTVLASGRSDLPYRVTPAVVPNSSEVVRVAVGALKSREDFEPVIQVEVALTEGGPPRNPTTGWWLPIGSYAGLMHNTVFDVLSQFQTLLDQGVN